MIKTDKLIEKYGDFLPCFTALRKFHYEKNPIYTQFDIDLLKSSYAREIKFYAGTPTKYDDLIIGDESNHKVYIYSDEE